MPQSFCFVKGKNFFSHPYFSPFEDKKISEEAVGVAASSF
jgi:hypothetical protein